MFLRIVSGLYGGRKIKTPSSGVRPTEEKVREAFFSALYSRIDFTGKSFLDLFGGSGAVAIEALSRGFEHAVVVEKNKKSLAVIKENLTVLNITHCSLLCADSFSKSITEKLAKGFDVVFIDPPYALSHKIPDLIEYLFEKDTIMDSSVIVVETGENFEYELEGFCRKSRNYGKTILTYYTEAS